ncbi:hypothetical protein F0U44_05785 [Nocardioides humilatus]|uniref:DUF4352 domain-containing protein n=1 Tax=Nocardioides humilatus TaxID=2607660 RepID=A0A5B1LQ10_9ACTN|nr:hypothetical protein [Nocardioides humilatus]KAA1421779.1 hypothetical protein F0U44_05785 [Nocardioides humilatus]
MRSPATPLIVLALLLSGCSALPHEDDEARGAAVVPLETGLTAYFDQGRLWRITRTAYVRLVNDGDHAITVLRAVVSSDRFDTVVWTGEEEFQNEVDLDFEVPPGRCGEGSDADVVLTYRVDDGPVVVSRTIATDRYGAIGLFLDRDCAQEVLGGAADLTLGDGEVIGEGLDSVYVLPVTFTPTGARDDVVFRGFEDTPLFRQADGSAAERTDTRVPLVGEPVTVELRIEPARCDEHALAEDKVGTLFGVRVEAPELADLPGGAFFYLPIGAERRAAMHGFFGPHCGF